MNSLCYRSPCEAVGGERHSREGGWGPPGHAPVRAGVSAGEAAPEEGTGPGTAPAPVLGLGWEPAAGTSPEAASPPPTLPTLPAPLD